MTDYSFTLGKVEGAGERGRGMTEIDEDKSWLDKPWLKPFWIIFVAATCLFSGETSGSFWKNIFFANFDRLSQTVNYIVDHWPPAFQRTEFKIVKNIQLKTQLIY